MANRRWTAWREHLAEAEAGRAFLWSPVVLALGIALYFALPAEPAALVTGLAVAGVLLMAGLLRRFNRILLLPTALALIASGFAAAKLRTEWVRAPVLAGNGGVYELEGRLLSIANLPGKAQQWLLDQPMIQQIAPEQTPARLRLTSRFADIKPAIGARIRLRALLRPPPGPVRPHAFDFARKAWFERIGAVGFAVSKADVIASPQQLHWSEAIEALRSRIASAIRAAAPGVVGEICVALVVGDQRGIDTETMTVIRTAGIAHMLSISGMHMALVAGSVYWLLRALLALSETLALNFDIRRGAALTAMLAAFGYYLISGMGVATLRSLLMICLVFLAIVLGRSALSLRNVALAALAILIVRPESLFDVSFQMSFAAVTALIALFERYPQRRLYAARRSRLGRLAGAAGAELRTVVLTTSAAGLAILPIGIYHFHQASTYAILGNLLAMPILSFCVMPLALAGTLLESLHGSTLPFALMGKGIEAILLTARFVADLDRARLDVGTIDLWPVLLMTAGGLWLALWRSRLRIAGILPVTLGLLLAPFPTRPFLLVDREGRNVALIDGRGLLWPALANEASFSLDEWRRAFGDTDITAPPKAITPARASPWHCDETGCTALFDGRRIAFSLAPAALDEDCRHARILIATYPVSREWAPCSTVPHLFDLGDIRRKGAVAVFLEGDEMRVTSNAEVRGERPWTQSR